MANMVYRDEIHLGWKSSEPWFFSLICFSGSSSPHYLTSVLKQSQGQAIKGKYVCLSLRFGDLSLDLSKCLNLCVFQKWC